MIFFFANDGLLQIIQARKKKPSMIIKVLSPKSQINIPNITQTLQIQCRNISLLMPRHEGQNSGTAFKHFIEDDRQRFTTKTCRRKEEQFFPAGNGSVML